MMSFGSVRQTKGLGLWLCCSTKSLMALCRATTEWKTPRRSFLRLSFHAHHDSRCFLPIHIYEAVTGKPVAVILRPGKTPDGAEVALVLRHVVKAIRRRWPRVEIVIRGDSHYARPEAMAFLERNRVHYVFGLAGNRVLLDRVAALAEDTAVRRAEEDADNVRNFHDFRYAAKSWKDKERRVIARIDATRQGSDTRFVVTNLSGTPRWLYEVLYCGRGQAENLIKAHKLHLASDRSPAHRQGSSRSCLCLANGRRWLAPAQTRNEGSSYLASPPPVIRTGHSGVACLPFPVGEVGLPGG